MNAHVEANMFVPARVLNKEELDAFRQIRAAINDPDHHGSMQTSLGALIRLSPKNQRPVIAEPEFLDLMSRINSKRPDFLITDREARPILVVEYDGSGHGIDPDGTAQRDEFLRTILKKIPIELLSVTDAQRRANAITKIVSDTLASLAR